MSKIEQAVFAGGCFWCMEPPFRQLAGVYSVVSGYTGGTSVAPTYEQVCGGIGGHYEAVQVEYDAEQVTYLTLLAVFWRQIDPCDLGGQFHDRGKSYQTAIFCHSEVQRQQAEASKQALVVNGSFNAPIVTEILPACPFYPAEAYHQNYAQLHPGHYQCYRDGSGRTAYLQNVWGKVAK